MDPHADRQAEPLACPRPVFRVPMASTMPKPGPHGALRIVFMRLGIAKIDQQAIAEILGNMALKALDDLSAGLLVGPHHLPQVFGIEPTGERGRIYQITEQHRELAAFSRRWLWSIW